MNKCINRKQKIADFNPTISTITLKKNGLNTLVKDKDF